MPPQATVFLDGGSEGGLREEGGGGEVRGGGSGGGGRQGLHQIFSLFYHFKLLDVLLQVVHVDVVDVVQVHGDDGGDLQGRWAGLYWS